LRVEAITAETSQINQYVMSTGEGKLCHLPKWGFMIAEVFGHKPLFLVAWEGGRICGVLPLMVVKSRLFGNRMISQAFSNYGGPLVTNTAALRPLLDRAVQLTDDSDCRQLEIRTTSLLSTEFELCRDKVCMHLKLTADPEEVWRQLRPEIRNRVRKAEKSGLVAVEGGEELLAEFYDVWTVRMRQLGTPCYPLRLFENLFRSFPEQTMVFLVRAGRETVAAGLFYHFNEMAQCRWAATRVEYNRLAPNSLLYWSAIDYYSRIGDRVFDFGRSDVDGSHYEFKRRWGSEEVPLDYQYWSESGHELVLVRPDIDRYERLVDLWKRLPLGVTRLLGPWLSRSLP